MPPLRDRGVFLCFFRQDDRQSAIPFRVLPRDDCRCDLDTRPAGTAWWPSAKTSCGRWTRWTRERRSRCQERSSERERERGGQGGRGGGWRRGAAVFFYLCVCVCVFFCLLLMYVSASAWSLFVKTRFASFPPLPLSQGPSLILLTLSSTAGPATTGAPIPILSPNPKPKLRIPNRNPNYRTLYADLGQTDRDLDHSS